MKDLLQRPGFIAFLMVAFINALVDLGHKIIIQNTVFKIYDGDQQVLWTAIVNALILLPALLVFTPAGFIGDRFRKPRVMQISALIAIGITLLITLSYYQGWFWVAFGMTFLLAMQSAFYAPAKYGYLKEIAGDDQLTVGNGLLQAVVIIGILAGVFLFSVLFEQYLAGTAYRSESDVVLAIAPLGWLLVILSVGEYLLARRIREYAEPDSQRRFEAKAYLTGRYLKNNVRALLTHPMVWSSIIGLAVFWGISQVTLATFPAYAKEVLAETNTVVIQGLIAMAGVGIGLGAILAARLSPHGIEKGLIPIGAVGLAGALMLLPQLSSASWIAFDFVLLGVFGGLFIVPLNALIQHHTDDHRLGTVLAGSNWLQNLVMVLLLVLTVSFSLSGTHPVGLLYLVALLGLVLAVKALFRLPQAFLRLLLGRVFALRYRLRVIDTKNLPEQGGVLLLGNHVSWLDWAMLMLASPKPIRFVMHKALFEKWHWNFVLRLQRVIPIAAGESRQAFREVREALQKGEWVCVFPEGRITHSSHLAQFRRGYEHMLEGVENVSIVPFHINGLWGGRFSRSSGRSVDTHRRGLRRPVVVGFGKALAPNSTPIQVKQRVMEVSMATQAKLTDDYFTLSEAWLKRVKRAPFHTCLIDAESGQQLNQAKAFTAASLIADAIGRYSPEQRVGLLLPTSSGGLLATMATLIAGKTLVPLNYTSSLKTLQSVQRIAGLQTVYTSRRFIANLEKRGIDLSELLASVKTIYLEDVKDSITTAQRLRRFISTLLLPLGLLRQLHLAKTRLDDEAAVLFSSGSEGEPKGIVLTHRQIGSNVQQVAAVLDQQPNDRVMSVLPIFHAFGLTATSLVPLLQGLPAICYPDPTQALAIAKAIARHKATVYCSTSSLLRLMERNSKVAPLLLSSLRLVLAGAERLLPAVRDAFQDKFGKQVFEGYGATEAAPVMSVNLPDRLESRSLTVQQCNKPGTVGLPVVGSAFRVVDPDSLQELPNGEAGLVLFAGNQLMLGYLDSPTPKSNPIVEIDGVRWYQTGDKGYLDQDGFLTLIDRYSRFAKLAGEMVSLGAVEAAISEQLGDRVELMATNIPDSSKGEAVILLYVGELSPDEVRAAIKQSSINSLWRPAQVFKQQSLPRLGTGKADFSKAKALAVQLVRGE